MLKQLFSSISVNSGETLFATLAKAAVRTLSFIIHHSRTRDGAKTSTNVSDSKTGPVITRRVVSTRLEDTGARVPRDSLCPQPTGECVRISTSVRSTRT